MSPKAIADLLYLAYIRAEPRNHSKKYQVTIGLIRIAFSAHKDFVCWTASTPTWRLVIEERNTMGPVVSIIEQQGDPTDDLIWLRLRT